MDKRLKKLLEQINAKKQEVASLVAADDLDGAKAAKTELVALQEKFDLMKDVIDDAAESVRTTGRPAETDIDGESKSTHEFAQMARRGFPVDVMTEGSNADGGYTVPDDVQTKINKYKEAHASLRKLVSVERVRTDKGARTFQTKAQATGFQKVDETGAIQAVNGPQFERITYSINDYSGYIPVSNDLLADSDANIESTIVEWLGENSVATDNNEILAIVQAKEPVILVDAENPLKPIKHVINVTLGQAYAGGVRIVTNDDGLDWLDNLVDSTGRPLVNPSLIDPGQMVLRVGARIIPIEVQPNGAMPSNGTYVKTADTSIVAGKTYYTRSGSEGSYTYTAVASPATASLGTYYEKSGIPLVIGDLKEGVKIFDREQTRIMSSDVASVTGYNAFEQRGRLFRGEVRADYVERDADAWVFGCIPGLG